ncbi:HD domain-containing protein [Clostridium fermenticellae]|uniref:bis(5'-nucleosyl)-tetraphosphatase (symmetrical) n=1 Tax=Clostridium fermenticellae TaxID=2068654 RepID=A0A386H611_9CLOT|nr:bis(5'-nucleosyl)-tetraphosphatase (symmetrical) YqeK [Clostridium fermenticellae]AYD41008.1 HD domain-containing protein [Clostridium fermenticellae]
MWNENDIIDYLKNHLKPERYEHSLSVRDTAVKLAQIYGADIYKARIAGLAHDCAKNMSDNDLLDMALSHNIKVDNVCMENPKLLHGIIGAIVAKEKFGIEDDEILSSIAYHTTGKKDMSLLQKVIYIADYVEPLRDFPGVQELREEVTRDLNKSILMAFNNTIKCVIDKGQLLHVDTIKGRNYILRFAQ